MPKKNVNTEDKFTNLHNLELYFASENKCIEYLEEQRWHGQPACLRCGSVEYWQLNHRGKKLYKCKSCDYKYNVLRDTIFENTKIPLIKWFKAIYLVFSHKKGISSIQLGKDLGFTQKSAWFVLGRLRKLAEEKTPFMLQGTVEVDETFVGGKAVNKPRSVRALLKTKSTSNTIYKTPVLGLLQRDGKIVTKVVRHVGASELLPVIEKHIAKGSFMVSDEHSAYKHLPKLGYTHDSVSHSKHEYVRGKVHTQQIEGYWAILKRGILGIYHKVSPDHLQRYCDEFSYRYNTRELKDATRFTNSLGRVDNTRLKYYELINKIPGQPKPGKMEGETN